MDSDEGDADTEALLRRLDGALPAPSRVLLACLAVLGVIQLVLVVPWLVGADPFGLLGSSATDHLTRDGALGLVVAIAALLTAWRPRWAVPCFVIASLALIAQTVAGVIDDSITDSGAAEFIHLPSIVITVLIGLAAVRLAPLGPRHGRLRSVADDPDV